MLDNNKASNPFIIKFLNAYVPGTGRTSSDMSIIPAARDDVVLMMDFQFVVCLVVF